MLTHSANPIHLLKSLFEHRELIRLITRRAFFRSYQGSIFGVAWSLITPLLMLCVYTFVFGLVLQARWAGADKGTGYFALVIFSGLMLHSFFSECLVEAASQIRRKQSFVKKVVFPLEILTWELVLPALIRLAINLLLLLGFFYVLENQLHSTIVYIPILILPLALLCAGLCWFLSALGVYFRDVAQLVRPLMTALLFLSPIFFSVDIIPEAFQPFALLNPLTIPIEQLRQVTFDGQPPTFDRALFFYYLTALLTLNLGFACFQLARRGFADVL